MPRTMRAALYHGARDIRVEEVPVPTTGPGEVLIRVLRSGVRGTDAAEWTSGPKTFPAARRHPVSGHLGPLIPGHEFVGEVVEADPTSDLAVGDLVASGAGIWCGRCRRCREGRTNQCAAYRTLGLNVHGGMAEFVAAPSRTLRRVPAGLSADHAALAQPLAVGVHAARRSGARDGDTVVVIGAGAIGSFVLAALKHLGTGEVLVVDHPGRRLDRASRLGADHVLPPSETLDADVVDALGGAPDVVVEASGAPGQLAAALRTVTDGGRVLAVGVPERQPALDVRSMVYREITLDTTLAHICDTDLPVALEILARGQLGAELAETPVGLDRLGESLDRLAAGHVEGKVLVDPGLAQGSSTHRLSRDPAPRPRNPRRKPC
ncbi:zinc-dependent alcohol dehydrogenase [Saccharothrix australiensis]|uniref:(R,R)-butanediol dehydrogenase/meso-butanediol dehydrogenase/diacetyl reductase n=1 Tax=Saccharothrix australiensis TaxID=2072 RepID=A0A495W1U4_9PSEU|nr:alcohol dehydrogenase catalytic domain-containing protein [Saccharothrix australiensis]RKT55596.1 (R,R)-butanediol dehydrogenase/meso-butanediol dehydrogenase/diacetyl reductase [Saccharothrix australiensis]